MSDSSEANSSTPIYPTSFGRGWIPIERDIGLPEDDCADLRKLDASKNYRFNARAARGVLVAALAA